MALSPPGIFEVELLRHYHLAKLEAMHFHRTAGLALDAQHALRAGDALHLTCAEQAGASRMATLDIVLGRNAQRLKIKPVVRWRRAGLVLRFEPRDGRANTDR